MLTPTRLLLSLISFLLPVSHSATIQCQEPEEQRIAAPPYEDCLTSIAHIPSHASALAGDQLLSLSHPFHPQAGFLHRRCKIIAFVHYEHIDDRPIHLDVDPIPIDETAQSSDYGELTQTNFFEAWNIIRQLARQVVEQCVEMRRVDGIGEEVMAATQGWNARYRVYANAVQHEGVWAEFGNHPVRAGRLALGHEEAASFLIWNDLFAQTYNVI